MFEIKKQALLEKEAEKRNTNLLFKVKQQQAKIHSNQMYMFESDRNQQINEAQILDDERTTSSKFDKQIIIQKASSPERGNLLNTDSNNYNRAVTEP